MPPSFAKKYFASGTPLLVKVLAVAMLCAASTSAPAALPSKGLQEAESPVPRPPFALNEYLNQQAGFTLPFYLLNGHILIDGAVNGMPGKFMFDTGTEFAFFLNNHYLPLTKDQFIAKGHTGSGQEIVLYRQTEPIARLDVAGQVHFENVRGVIHTDWGFLEAAYGIRGFLGSIGHGFNQNYIFVIDYDLQTIAFHPLTEGKDVVDSAIDPARVVATMAFTPTGVDGKMPEVEVRVGDETITAFFDTGNPGTLELTESMKNILEQRKNLTLTASNYAYGAYETRVRATLTGLSYGQQSLYDVRNLTFHIGTQNRVGLGYQFLKNYVSVWDFKHRTLTLLKPL